MAEIVESVEISRRPEDVFSYVADPSHHPEWIESVVSVRREGDGPLAVGSRVVATRRVGPWELRYTEEMAELNPPRSWASRGVGGVPVIAFANGMVELLDNGKRSRVTIACEFQGHGIGKLLVPLLARRLELAGDRYARPLAVIEQLNRAVGKGDDRDAADTAARPAPGRIQLAHLLGIPQLPRTDPPGRHDSRAHGEWTITLPAYRHDALDPFGVVRRVGHV